MGIIISNVKKSLNQKQIVELYEIIFYNTKGNVSSHTLNRLQSLDNPVEMNNTNKSNLYNYTPYQRSSPISQLRIQQSTKPEIMLAFSVTLINSLICAKNCCVFIHYTKTIIKAVI